MAPLPHEAAIRRLSSLASLSTDVRRALGLAARQSTTRPARSIVVIEGHSLVRPLLLLAGWAARVRLMPDGRRQILSFILPGEFIGNCRQARPCANSTVVALTDIRLCAAPTRGEQPGLEEVYALSQALDEAYILAQVARLGRMTAAERIADMLLEFMERLGLAGLQDGRTIMVPLTQHSIADATGLTSVHVNRTIQSLRRHDLVEWRNNLVTIDCEGLRRLAGRAHRL